jgi:prevent-host-death family protein
MQSVGIKALKSHLSEYVRAAAAGETVLVTNRGQAVAELVPPRVRADALPTAGVLGDLLRQGLLVPAKLPPKARLPRRKPVAKFEEVLRDLQVSRDERRSIWTRRSCWRGSLPRTVRHPMLSGRRTLWPAACLACVASDLQRDPFR